MDDKISPELKLAMDADGYMPYSSLYLGYNASDDSWMLIIRHSGDIDDLEGDILNSERVFLQYKKASGGAEGTLYR